MQYRILGPLEVERDGVILDLGPLKQRSLLALLLINANRVVSTDRILEELWGEDAQGKENALWVYISRLRSVVEQGRDPTVLLTRDHGYTLNVDPSDVDVFRFESAVAAGRSAMKDDPEGAADTLRDALHLWRGEAFEDFGYAEFAQVEIKRLNELRVAALEDRVESDLRAGSGGELIPELEALADEHPLRERPVSLLMLALYRAGRQAEALRTFERFRRTVGEEMGIEPSPELSRLEEQILLHDSRLQQRIPRRHERAMPAERLSNPFKGLQTFQEDDSDDFFGRDRLVADLIRHLGGGESLITLVGPSGSGKSSVVRAGLIPALRKGAIPNSDQWLLAQMVPGSHPFAELEAALLRSTIDAPDSLSDQLAADDDASVLRAVLRVLPTDASTLVLVIDQLEELFVLVDDPRVRERFLDALLVASDDPRGRLKIVTTLRADFYERPLSHAAFGARMSSGVINVVSMTPDELEQAVREPAMRGGLTVDPALVARLVAEAVGQPGGLPLFQYTLTELFNRRVGSTLSAEVYDAIGGFRGAIAKRAEDLYANLDAPQQAAARQLFLRLVAISETDEWSRRRVHAADITSLEVDIIDLQAVIEAFGDARFLTFDRDYVSGSPTVEVAHEALLTQWDRLRGWINEFRLDVMSQARLAAAADDWRRAECDEGYLLTGARLADFEAWSATSDLALTTDERRFLDESIQARNARAVAEEERAHGEHRLRTQAKRRLWALAAAIVVLAGVAGAIALSALLAADPLRVALVYGGRDGNSLDRLLAAGLDRAAEVFEIETTEITAVASLESTYRQLGDAGVDLVIASSFEYTQPIDQWMMMDETYPDTVWAAIDAPAPDLSLGFAEHEAGFLAGAAAALATDAKQVGFIGGSQWLVVERFRAGFEHGVATIDPSIQVVSTFISVHHDAVPYQRPDLAQQAAAEMYSAGIDVIFPAAGESGHGVLEAARNHTDSTGEHVWFIGVDDDDALGLAAALERHVLASAILQRDVAVIEAVRTLVEDRGAAPTLSLSNGGVGLVTRDERIGEGLMERIHALELQVGDGTLEVASVPVGDLLPPVDAGDVESVVVTFDGSTCSMPSQVAFASATDVRVIFENRTSQVATLQISMVDVPNWEWSTLYARENATAYGYIRVTTERPSAFDCYTGFRGEHVAGPSLSVGR